MKALDVQVIGLTTDPIEKARETREKVKIPFPVLSDAKRQAMEIYGTRNPDHAPDEDPINTPTLVLIDKSGTIRWIHQAADYRVRAPISKVLEEARKLQ
ncbi:MAG: redoxin domain-containing protein [Acidobacteria bacterium]|nr:redoxin domain-containing protein [Acidobacteriota bacterium]